LLVTLVHGPGRDSPVEIGPNIVRALPAEFATGARGQAGCVAPTGASMLALLQRVTQAEVRSGDEVLGRIGPGLLVLVGVERGDDERRADRLLERLLTYRVFADAGGRMNLGLQDTGGGLLLVPQFTLAADTRKGRRPSFSCAAGAEDGRRLFDHLVAAAQAQVARCETGRFGCDMQVTLTNDGPVTFLLQA
jgi:D-tyrosyl-tRNA(Tyr) deacylase